MEAEQRPPLPPFDAESAAKKARAAEDAWEARALEMHARQKTITLAPKPAENALSRIERGD